MHCSACSPIKRNHGSTDGANRLAKKCRHSEKLYDVSTLTLKCSGDCRSIGVVTTSCEHETVANSMSRRRIIWKQEFIHHMHILARCHGNRTASFIFEKMRTNEDQTPTARTVKLFFACEVVSNTTRITFSQMCNFALFTQLDNSSDIIQFDVFPTVHHSIGYFLEPTLMHTSI